MQPALGSLAIHSPASSQKIHISSSTCHDLSLFKDILREYRRLDDTIVMRLNRANAALRDQERSQDTHVKSGHIQEQTCALVWEELVNNWNRRKQLINYCAAVVDKSLDEKRQLLQESVDPAVQRQQQAALFAEERNQVRNELSVETIIRRRSVNAFRSRCQYFPTPPEIVEQE
ncbi:caffeine-induced death protein 2 [Infundibulicybe gibba]|nr:caffeine-induced death protein 2 [Infundibulicybe gibba]